MDVTGDREQRWRSYSSFGLFRDGDDTSRRNRKSRRFQLSFAAVVVGLLAVTGVFVGLQLTRSRDTATKAKRFVQNDDATKKPQTDVDIIPEAKTHPNHRYGQQQPKDKVMERMMKNLYSEWSPVVETTVRNNIRDIIRRIEMRDGRNPRGLMKPIMFKGVYTRKGEDGGGRRDTVRESDREYFKEINEMLRGEEKSTEEKSARRGSPFQLKNAVGDEEEIRKKARKPITVMLDIYPITKPEVEGPSERRKKPELMFPAQEPISSGGKNVAYAVVPTRGGKGRMIMKLNLYPKKKKEAHMNRRTFGWFRRPDEGHVCQLIAHNPDWRPVTAEWTDEDGDWVKSNYVTLKYWDRKFT